MAHKTNAGTHPRISDNKEIESPVDDDDGRDRQSQSGGLVLTPKIGAGYFK